MRQEKQLLLNEIKGQIDQFDSFVIMHYAGLEPIKLMNFDAKLQNRRQC